MPDFTESQMLPIEVEKLACCAGLAAGAAWGFLAGSSPASEAKTDDGGVIAQAGSVSTSSSDARTRSIHLLLAARSVRGTLHALTATRLNETGYRLSAER
jgi:hypothetical protein